MPRLSISEVLFEATRYPPLTQDRKHINREADEQLIQWLIKNDSKPLRMVVRYMYGKDKPLLPEGAPPYREQPEVGTHGILFREYRKIPFFFEGGLHPQMTSLKRETAFIGMLEAVHPDDAKLLINMKDKVVYERIKLKHIKAAFGKDAVTIPFQKLLPNG